MFFHIYLVFRSMFKISVYAKYKFMKISINISKSISVVFGEKNGNLK